MRLLIGALALVCVSLAAVGLEGQDLFDTPLRINMGGPQTVDAYGRRWLGDAAGDALGIRPDDGDDGAQGITYEWTQVDPPNPSFGGSTFATPDAAMTEVVIRQGAGTYRFRLDIDDGQPCDNSASVEVEVEVIAGVLFVRGDVDSSGTVELTDGVIALGFLFSGGPPPACFDSADVDDGGSVELTDAVIIFTWLFLGGPPPQAPTPSATTYPGQDCGIDPVDDALDCAVAGAVCS